MARPQKYSDYELRNVLMSVSMNNKKKITPSLLEKETGIKRHIWLRRMKKEIELVNKSTIFYNDDSLNDLPIPNIVNIIDKYYEDKEKLINELVWYNEKLGDAYSKILENKKLMSEIKNLNEILQEKDLEINELKKKCKHFETLYLELETRSNIFDGISTLETKGKVIELEKQRKEIASFNFEKQFPDIFKENE